MRSHFFSLIIAMLFVFGTSARAVTVNFAAPEMTAKENAGTVNATIVISDPQPTAVEVHYAVTSTCFEGSDYIHLSGIAVLPPFAQAVQVPITLVNDNTMEAAEDLILDITHTNMPNVSYGSTQRFKLTINDDDVPLVNFTTSANARIEDGGTVSPQVALTKASTLPVDIYYRVGGTATSGSDYNPPPGVLHLAPGVATGQIPIKLIDDKEEEETETIIVEIYSAVGANLGNTLTYSQTLTDNEDPSAYFSTSETKVVEAQKDITVDVELKRPAGKTVTVNYELGGTATAGSDYLAISKGTVTFGPTQTLGTIPITIKDDTEIEGNETIIMTLTGATNATLKDRNTHAVHIIDNEVPAVDFYRTADSVMENEGIKLVTVQLSHAWTKTVEVKYTVEGTATAGEDYFAMPGTLTFPVGSISETISLPVKNDNEKEDRETVVLRLTDPGSEANLGINTEETVTIVDDDQSPPLQISPAGMSSSSPDICIDQWGNAHIIFRSGNGLYYTQVNNKNEIVAPARCITTNTNVIAPRAAVDAKGDVHVVYMAYSDPVALSYVRISSGTLVSSSGIQFYPLFPYMNHTYGYPAIAVNPKTDQPVVIAEGRIEENGMMPQGRNFITAMPLSPTGKPIMSSRWEAWSHDGYSVLWADRADLAIGGDGIIRAVWRHKGNYWPEASAVYRTQAMESFVECLPSQDLLSDMNTGSPQIRIGADGMSDVVWATARRKKMMHSRMNVGGGMTTQTQEVSDLDAVVHWPQVAGGFGRLFYSWIDSRTLPMQTITRISDEPITVIHNISESPSDANFQRMAARSDNSFDTVWTDARSGVLSVYYRTWSSGVLIQSQQQYERLKDQAVMTAKVVDMQAGEIKVGQLSWTLSNVGQSGVLATGKMAYNGTTGQWEASKIISPSLNPGAYRVDYVLDAVSGARALSGKANGQFVVAPFFTIKGKVTEKTREKKPLKNVMITLSPLRELSNPAYTVYTDAAGMYEIKNVEAPKAKYARAYLEHYTRFTREVICPGEGQQLTMDFELTDGTDRPVVNGIKLKYDGIFLSGIGSFVNTLTANVEWNGCYPGRVEYYANDKLAATYIYSSPNAEPSVWCPIGTWFPGQNSLFSNRIKVVAIDSKGEKSKQNDGYPVYVIVTPLAYEPFFALWTCANGLVSGNPMIKGEYTWQQWEGLKSIPVIGKIGPTVKMTMGAVYKFANGEWQFYMNGRPSGSLAPEFGADKLTSSNKEDAWILLHMGELQGEVVGGFKAIGRASVTQGIVLNDVELLLKSTIRGKVLSCMVSQLIPGGWVASLLDWLKRWNFDINSLQRVDIWAELAGTARTTVGWNPKFTWKKRPAAAARAGPPRGL